VAEVLIESGADANAIYADNGHNPLHTACEHFRQGWERQIFRVLISAGADTQALDHQDRLPIDLLDLPDLQDVEEIRAMFQEAADEFEADRTFLK
jgi:ankyrin repeat protein